MIDQEYKAWSAFQLHALGLVVLPVHYPVDGHCSCRGSWTCGSPAKHPAVSWKGVEEQREDDVYRMLREYPQHNLGVRLAGSRFVVLDVDPAAGGSQALAEFETRRGEPLTPTLTVITGNGGRHLYYRLPNNAGLRGDRLLFLHGVDAKASGVMVVPPSRSMWGGEYVIASALGTAPAVSSVRGDLFLHGVDGKASGVMVVPPSRSMSGGEYVFASALGTAPALIPDDVLARLHPEPRGRHAPPAHRTLHARSRRDQAVRR